MCCSTQKEKASVCRRSGACRLQYSQGEKMLQTKLCQIFFHLDHHIIPYAQYCHVYNANMVERNWICFGIWSSHAENLEVSESVPLWPEFSNLFKYCEHKVDITESASAQFPIWIFNFWPHGRGQLRALLKKKWANYEQLLRAFFSCFRDHTIFF
jgi:hypothetical protein